MQERQLIPVFYFLSLLQTDGNLIGIFFLICFFCVCLFFKHFCETVLKPLLRKWSTESEPGYLCVQNWLPLLFVPQECVLSSTAIELP